MQVTAKDAFAKAKREWASKSRLYTVNTIRDKFLSGQALGRKTGTLVRSVTSESSSGDESFVVGTSVVYGVGWELGFTRPEYVIYPKTAQALRIPVAGGFIFRKWARIPSKRFAARPFLRPGLEASYPYMIQTGHDVFAKAGAEIFPNRIIRAESRL